MEMHRPKRFILPKLETAAPLLMAAALTALTSILLFRSGSLGIYLDHPELGGFLLAGLPNNDIGLNMPLFGALAACFRGAGAGLVFLLAVRFGIYCLVFAAGSLLRDRRAGLAAMAAAGLLELSGAFSYDAEQSFYALLILLSFCLLLIRNRGDSLKNAALAGLAIGATLLVRTPLLLFPPLAALGSLVGRGKPTADWIKRTALFLVSSYALLLPWGALNYSVSGTFKLADTGRAASNLITAAQGGVYTMNGDPYQLAGLAPGESAAGFYLREAAKKPAASAQGLLKRLLAIFLFHPLLLSLLAAAALIGRGKLPRSAFGLPVYLIIIHAFFSVEERYFYPLLYLCPPLIVAAFLGGERKAVVPIPVPAVVRTTFLIVMAAVTAVEALVLAYPQRAARGGSFSGAGWNSGNDEARRVLACREMWVRDGAGEYDSCLRRLGEDFGGFHRYFYSVYSSADPSYVPLPREDVLRGLISAMLREFELGEKDSAEKYLGLALRQYDAGHNMLRGAPYAADRQLEARMKRDTGAFWSSFVYPSLLSWPPERALRISRGLSEAVRLDGPVKLLADALEEMSSGSFGPAELRLWAAPPALGLSPAGLRALWTEGGSESARLLAIAAREADAGRKEAALLRALDIEFNPASAEVYMALCSVRAEGGSKSAAIKACQSASYAAYFGAEAGPPVSGSEASFRSYELLSGLGRASEAKAALERAVWNAPASWPRLEQAKVLLAKKSR